MGWNSYRGLFCVYFWIRGRQDTCFQSEICSYERIANKKTLNLKVCGLFILIFRIFDTKIQGLLHSIFLTVYRYSTGLSLKFEIWKYSTVPYRAKSLYCTCTVPCHTLVLVRCGTSGENVDRKDFLPECNRKKIPHVFSTIWLKYRNGYC